MRRMALITWLAAALLALTGAAPAPMPQLQCHYEADIVLGDDAGYLRGTPIGHIAVTACSSPADLAAQVSDLEGRVRAQWAASRGGR